MHAESDALADALRFERRTWRGGELVLRLSWPVDQHRSFRFPAGPAESELRYADDGSTDGWDGGRHRVRVSRNEGVLLWAELDVRVPRRALEAGFYNRAGGVTASGVQGTLRFDTAAGAIEIDHVSGDVLADSGSGDVRLRLPRDASFELRADTGSGDVKSRFPDSEPIVRRREVIGYRRGDGHVKIDVDTGSGDVTVEPLS